MVNVGIDSLAIYTPPYAFDLVDLATARGVPADKYQVGLGQFMMSVPPPGEDSVTMAASAAKQALQGVPIEDIAMVLFATESSVDQSKAASIYVHALLKLHPHCRALELKQACYSATAAIQLSMPFLRENPEKKILLVASDIARYGLSTPGEPSQGAGAVAMVLSANPRLLALEPHIATLTEHVMDFWRPNYLREALVDGKYSSKLYLTMLEKTWRAYQALSGRGHADHAYFCYHAPVPRLVEKAHLHLSKLNGAMPANKDDLVHKVQQALAYGRQIGNTYTASLYVSLASLLDLASEDLSGKRIGFYSYGSGCVAEYFSGIVQPNYRHALYTAYHRDLIANRTKLSYEQYEKFYHFRYSEDGQDQTVPLYRTGPFRLSHMAQHQRIYEERANDTQQTVLRPNVHKGPDIAPNVQKRPCRNINDLPSVQVRAPGKLILSGEHAVLYGQPALAMAINRYVKTTVTKGPLSQILFDLSDLAYQAPLSFNALRRLKDKIKNKYHRFVRGEFTIRDVLQKPFELAQFALGTLTEALELALPPGTNIKVQSDLPIGCGMGSSAATILSVMQAMACFSSSPLPEEKLFKLALEAENMQHGQSSGLDLHIALRGGCLLMEGPSLTVRPLPTIPLYLVHTGVPATTTGQCVEHVAPYFKSAQLQDAFATATRAMDKALAQQSWHTLRDAIRENHRLLAHIGVVPSRVQQFVKDIESVNGAAKVCGAGAISGENAGALLVAIPEGPALANLCARSRYQFMPVSGEPRGVHAA